MNWLRNKLWRKRSAKIFLTSLCVLVALAYGAHKLFPLPKPPKYSPVMLAADSSVLDAALSPDDKWRLKTPLHEITPDLRRVIIHKEDRFFYYHFGVNPVAIAKALLRNTIRGRKISGASTITMQVARLLQPKSRTYGNKLVEILRAFQLEWQYSKDEILQLYLNLVSYGGNIEGVKSASVLYFGSQPNRLSLAQIVTLAIVPNRPTSLRLGNPDKTLLRQERNKWLQRLLRDGVFDSTTIADAMAEPLHQKRQRAPQTAPHLFRLLCKRYPDEAIIYTRINAKHQQKIQQIAYNYVQRLHFRQIHNACVLVLDNQKHEVIAYIGSSDFHDNQNGGQVNGVRAIRSPGSTLKPLIYGMAFDRGLLTPKTILNDVPTSFSGFVPDNFDHKFNGRVTMETALAYSLNIPAVKTLDMIGVLPFTTLLKQAGFEQIAKDQQKLGLSLILGGCGVTLEELCNLYAAFANKGQYFPATYLANEKAVTHGAILSESAAYTLTDILSQISRPDLPHNFASSYHIPKVAWKTGTSYGRKDAWSIGYNHRYTVGVWVGNFTAEGVPELTGTDIATPLMFEIFNTIDYNSNNTWFRQPQTLKNRLVCTETGKLPNHFCKEVINDYYLPLISSGEVCQHLKEVSVAADESYAYCKSCVPENGYKRQFYYDLAPELLAFYRDNGDVNFRKIPPHYPRCQRIFTNKAPVIVSPAHNHEYLLEPNEPMELMLSCQANADVSKVFWYIDDEFYKEAKAAEKVFFSPTGGHIKISCTDDKGRTSHIEILVK
jgi:penicillin-binding protein 1C